jgi:high affinity Mn2+ porin
MKQLMHQPTTSNAVWIFVRMAMVLAVLAFFGGNLVAQKTDSRPTPGLSEDDDHATTMFEHPDESRYWISGSINFIGQGHEDFMASYSGEKSLRSKPEFATSGVVTLYACFKLTRSLQVLVTSEEAVGHAVSSGFGLGGSTNPDNTHDPLLGRSPYIARAMVRYSIPLGGGMVSAERNQFDLSTNVSARRLELIGGKFALNDFFDQNDVSSDSDLQFMNLTVNQNGAWDYAGNSRGFTNGAIVQLIMPRWALRFGESLMPKAPGSQFLDANLSRAHSDNAEWELHPIVDGKFMSVIRLFAFGNHALMGKFRDAILTSQRSAAAPDITAHRLAGRTKYGFGANFQQNLGAIRLFSRGGWNDGHDETSGYTEVDRTVSFGGDIKGNIWHRKLDRVGAAFVVNGLSADHRQYLATGGMGTWIGDGQLKYATEKIFESYYTLHCWRGVFLTADLQHITNPAYNEDRGPVLIPGFRLHVDF